jgi:hypothetical protein
MPRGNNLIGVFTKTLQCYALTYAEPYESSANSHTVKTEMNHEEQQNSTCLTSFLRFQMISD